MDVVVEVEYHVAEVLFQDGLQIAFQPIVNVVELIEIGSDVSPERPTLPTSIDVVYQHLKRVSFGQFSNVDDIFPFDHHRHNLEECVSIGQLGRDLDIRWERFVFTGNILFLELLDQLNYRLFFFTVHRDKHTFIIVVLHDFEYLDLIELEVGVIEEDQRSEEVQQLRPVIVLAWQAIDDIADGISEVGDLVLVVKHVLVVVVHLSEEIDHTHIELEVVLHRLNILLDLEFAFLIVRYQSREENVAHMEQFRRQSLLGARFAIDNIFQNMFVDLGVLHDLLVQLIVGLSFVCKIYEAITGQERHEDLPQ